MHMSGGIAPNLPGFRGSPTHGPRSPQAWFLGYKRNGPATSSWLLDPRCNSLKQHRKRVTMGLGVIEPTNAGHVSGTVLLDQQAAHSEQQTGRLKHGTGKNSHIVLAPQPSEDPNDPLNWSSVKKHFVLSVIFFGVIIRKSLLLKVGASTRKSF